MKKIRYFFVVSLLSVMIFACSSAWANVPIDAAHFPDPIFLEKVKEYDSGWRNSSGDLVGYNDGILSDVEISRITYIYVNYNVELSSLVGIQYFTALTRLDCCSNQLTKLDVSGLTALTELNCSSNQLTKLDVSGCTALTYLVCAYNQLTELNVSGCTALEDIHCKENQLTEINASGCRALAGLNLDENPLTKLNFSGCTSLRDFWYVNLQLKELDFSGCTALSQLQCDGNKLTKLNLSGCSALKYLSCPDNRLTKLDLSDCLALKELDCSFNQLTELNLSGYSVLQKLNCHANKLVTLILSGCTVLEELDCGGNKLTELDLSDCTALEELTCWNNQLTKLDLSHNTNLYSLNCTTNYTLTSLILGNNTQLTNLECGDNYNLKSLDISGCPNLVDFNVHEDTIIIREKPAQPEFKYHSLMLDGQIGVNFYVYLPEIEGVDYSDGNTCYMEFDINGDKSNNPQTIDYDFCFSDGDGKTYYGFRAYIKSVQMADDITAIFHYGDNETVTHNYKAKEYLDAALARDDFSEAEKNLMIAIKDYGHYVQPMLSKNNNWVIGVDYAEMDCETIYDDNDVDGTREAAKPYSIIRDPGNSGIERVSFNLALGSETTINLNLIVSSNYNGNVSAVFDGGTENIAVKQSNGTYKIQIANIPAHELGDNNVIKVTAGESFDVVVSALSYVDAILNIDSTDEERKAATALFKYYEAAMAYKRSIGK